MIPKFTSIYISASRHHFHLSVDHQSHAGTALSNLKPSFARWRTKLNRTILRPAKLRRTLSYRPVRPHISSASEAAVPMMQTSSDEDDDPCRRLILSYHELNLSSVEESDEAPSALQFMRHVAKNRPFVVRSGAKDWDAVKKWDAKYLRRVMGGEKVRVAVTPKG